MAYIKEYWTDKEKRAKTARDHSEKMAKKYREQIEACIKETIIYDPSFYSTKHIPMNNSKIIVDALDSVSAIQKYANGEKMAVLNFSSYKNPGGMFLNGSKAQEECLCHESCLYNVLEKFKDTFYSWNEKHKNKALYLNRALYTPNIVFIKNGKEIACDVITCAAPNKSAAQKYQSVSDEENSQVLDDRIRFVLDVAKENEVKTLILGAYGCGVFGQDASEVASVFKHYLNKSYSCFDTVIFAIPDARDGNYKKFVDVFPDVDA